MIRSRLNPESLDLHDQALMGCDWANLAKCASLRASCAGIKGHEVRAAREAATAEAHWSRYLIWPLR